jgi:hypothetical protein
VGTTEWIALEPALRRDTEQFGDEELLTDGVIFGQPLFFTASHAGFLSTLMTHGIALSDASMARKGSVSLPLYFA